MLTSYKGQNIYADDIGNMLSDEEWLYTWEHGRQLVSMYEYNNDEYGWEFTYDADGMRTKRSDGSTTYEYVYNGSQLSYMTVDGNTLQFIYSTTGAPLAVIYNDEYYYYLTNIQGDVIALLDTDATTVVTYTYDAWGNVTVSGPMDDDLGIHNPLRYRGYVYDEETQLYYLQSRYYNPELGRFINADGISYLGADGSVVSYNLFAYCGNNPVTTYDPSGHLGISLLVGLGIAFVVGSVSSAVSQGVQYGWENINYLQAGIDGLFAVASTALAYTGIGLPGSILAGAGLGFAQYAVDSAVFHDDFTWSGAIIATGLGALGGLVSGRGAQHAKAIASNLDETGRTGVKAILTAYNKYGYGTGYQKVLHLWGGRVADSLARSISQNFTKSAVKIYISTVVCYGASFALNLIDYGF